ncbi:MAG: trypsin-like peptidase domain-containing protein [Clostridia bacterium]|nr:trypsin-like peptidase domain-containing protein [Clostridia bacterium]
MNRRVLTVVILSLFLGGCAKVGPTPQAKPLPGRVGGTPAITVAREVSPAVVGISNLARVKDPFDGVQVVERGSGSGVIFDERGYIVTNYHVVEGAEALVVSLADGRQVEGRLRGGDQATDLAVLKINSEGLRVADLGSSDQLQVGEMAVAIGNPLGHEFARSVTVGVISALNRQISVGDRVFQLIQTDAAINPGNSGGALVNAHGQVVGINSAKLSAPGVEGMGFAIPISKAQPIMESLMSRGTVERAWLGVKAGTVDGQLAKEFKLSRGALVLETDRSGPAFDGGIRQGDVITGLCGKEVKGAGDLSDILDGCKVREKVPVLVNRNGKEIKLNLVLSGMP